MNVVLLLRIRFDSIQRSTKLQNTIINMINTDETTTTPTTTTTTTTTTLTITRLYFTVVDTLKIMDLYLLVIVQYSITTVSALYMCGFVPIRS